MAYTTNTALKTYLGVTSATDDTLMTTLIARAQALIDEFTRRTFEASADTTRYFDAEADVSDDSRTLYLDEDLCALTSVTNGDSVAVTLSNLVKEPRNRTPWFALTFKSNSSEVWTWDDTPENAITVVGKWAYSTAAPDDIVHACIRLTAYLYRQKDTQGGNPDRATVTPEGLISLPAGIPSDIRDILNNYRRQVP